MLKMKLENIWYKGNSRINKKGNDNLVLAGLSPFFSYKKLFLFMLILFAWLVVANNVKLSK